MLDLEQIKPCERPGVDKLLRLRLAEVYEYEGIFGETRQGLKSSASDLRFSLAMDFNDEDFPGVSRSIQAGLVRATPAGNDWEVHR